MLYATSLGRSKNDHAPEAPGQGELSYRTFAERPVSGRNSAAAPESTLAAALGAGFLRIVRRQVQCW